MFKKKKIEEDISNEAIRFDDLSILDKHVKDKQIIVLGESSHGINDYYQIKINIIKYLHEVHNFSHVIFENGFLESSLGTEVFNDKEIDQFIKEFKLDIYHNEEMLNFYKRNWEKSLKFWGMDAQPVKYSEKFMNWIITIASWDIAKKVIEAEEMFFNLESEIDGKRKKTAEDKEKQKHCELLYEELINLFSQSNNSSVGQLHLNILINGFKNRIEWLQLSNLGVIKSGSKRGELMFNNVNWLKESIIHDEKIIIWAHNYHIRKSQTTSSKLLSIRNMGQYLNEKFKNNVYTIGFYAINGNYSNLLREDNEIKTTNKKHLERQVENIIGGNTFLALNDANCSLNKRWWLLESGLKNQLPMSINPYNHYDALIILKNVKKPKYF
ncbi:erythromycin esterase family protein [Alkalibacillus haloalkaliphilus]|uniref:erythromycin esterase family protein n=1 Tax=Alkalibacillus haloalkaliphilus TaxID=94136 RepID=UPI002935A3B9|nr:erythromycin esterase family protein [Alkalibacillus haloalkaliphilus]MDV2582046.1 erythromycin esterase family protein [Alkalibacillus haloalkaliphilus]